MPKKTKEVWRPLVKSPKKFRFQSVDTEDDSEGHLLQIGFWGDIGHAVFKKQIEGLMFIYGLIEHEAPKKDFYLVAHNLEYDVVNLLWGTKLFDEAEMTFSGFGMVSCKIRGLTMIDSFRHCPYPLAVLGDVVGVKKLAFNPASEDYVLTDARIPYEYMIKAQEEYNLLGAQLRSTTPATAVDLFRRKYMDSPLPIFETERVDWYRKGYYGGRTECFFIGSKSGDIEYFDVNSMYPYAMLGDFPDLWTLKYTKAPRLDGMYGMAEAEVEAPLDMVFPLLPVRIEGKLVFPVGRWKAIYTVLELRAARDAGYNIRPIEGYVTHESVQPFREYVETLYALRRQAKLDNDMVKSTVYKLMMNSLYGKFGAGKETIKLIDASDVPEGLTVTQSFGGKVLIHEETEYPPYANCIWAAYVTARARVLLWQYIRQAAKYGNVLYCDTDSIIMERKKKVPWGKSVELGELAFHSKADYVNIVLPKVYQFGEEYKAKGARDKKSFIEGHVSREKQPIRLREGLKRGLRPNVWVYKTKVLRGKYDKRIVLPDGFTKPLVLK
jgi:hypothetical protein